MKRKSFIANSSLLCLSLNSLTQGGEKEGKEKKGEEGKAENEHFAFDEITIDELQRRMRTGELTAKKIADAYFDRIEAIDKDDIALRAVLTLNPLAIPDAVRMDEERKKGRIRSPLHGIPVLVKDNINTSDISTTAGSLALEGFKPVEDAFIIKKLRDAGAVILGKGNLSEWANMRSEHSSSGWSSLGGQTKNPYILDRNPVGSSSGSAVGVAANLCMVAVGTETDGSIVAPSSANGIVGIKPTVGLLSRSGIIPISQTQDTPGPMARTVRDAAILLGLLTGTDPTDPATAASTGKSYTDYTQFLDVQGLKGKRIGIEKNWTSANTDVNRLYQKALALLRQAGAEPVEVELLKEVEKAGDAEFTMLKVELKHGLNRYLAAENAPVKSLEEVIEFNRKHEAKAMPFFKQEIFEAAEKTTGLESKEYTDAKEKCRAAAKAVDDIFSANHLDAFTGITMGPPCSTDLIYGDRYGDAGLSSPAAITGLPHITVPCGFIYRLPVGLSFFALAWQEPKLLSMAYAYEQLNKGRMKPGFFETFED